MQLTRNMKIFGGVNIASSVAFFYLLDRFISDERWTAIWVLAVGYGLTWFVTGLILGGLDKARNYQGNMDFMYHLLTVVISVAISGLGVGVLAFLTLRDWLLVCLIAIVSLGLHWYGTKRDTKGIPKEEAFK